MTGLPYGQYMVVETTIPQDVFQCDPFGFTVDSTTPQSFFCQPNGSVTEPSNSYLTYNILDEEMEGYLKLVKVDAETAVLQYSSACITLEAVVDRPKGKSHTTQILVSVPSHSSMAMGREAGLMPRCGSRSRCPPGCTCGCHPG